MDECRIHDVLSQFNVYLSCAELHLEHALSVREIVSCADENGDACRKNTAAALNMIKCAITAFRQKQLSPPADIHDLRWALMQGDKRNVQLLYGKTKILNILHLLHCLLSIENKPTDREEAYDDFISALSLLRSLYDDALKTAQAMEGEGLEFLRFTAQQEKSFSDVWSLSGRERSE